jgi:hypothetical protein
VLGLAHVHGRDHPHVRPLLGDMLTCPVVGWCFMSTPRRGGGRIDRRSCPECGAPGRRMRHADGTASAVMAEHRPLAPEPTAPGVMAPPAPPEPSQAV